MVWQKKEQLKRFSVSGSNLGLWTIVFAMCIFIIGNIGAELFTMRASIIITIVSLFICSFGIQITTAIAVPLLYLFFMVPLPAIIYNKIAFPLQFFAAKLTSDVIQFIGIPLLREGNILHLQNTTLEVVDACSGLRSLTSLLALSAAFAYIVNLTTMARWLLFLSAIPIAIVVNILRLTSTALLATYIGPETAQGFLHEMSGVLVFLAAFIVLYALYFLIQKIEQKMTSRHQE
jgi:exosortase